ncbi:PTS transporter subunit EIIC [Levilactobacillus bambusae]|uniref:Permease IIC component n=1 Tax=Levilactobacillus bambusae TaxID=2024736 RepID=A0A2V1N111_9LACO|nr:PTS transporter subunit EIIC [Levilactobacillus bambusae]PWG00075.1 hypothetical protein DCM90_03825 [Levilactobacillus bambusae]
MKQFWGLIENGLVDWLSSDTYFLLKRILTVIFPLVWLSAMAELVVKGCLTSNGYYYQTLGVKNWLPGLSVWRTFFQLLQQIPAHLIAIMGCYVTAEWVSRFSGDHKRWVGITAVAGYLMLNTSSLSGSNATFYGASLGYKGLFLAVMVGYFVGWIIRLANHRTDSITTQNTIRGWALGMVILFAGIGLLVREFVTTGLVNVFYRFLTYPFQSTTKLLAMLGESLLNGFYWLIGLNGPLAINNNDVVSSLENFAYVITHDSLKNLPYPVTFHTVVDTFATFGGPGMTLGLIIAILLASDDHHERRITWLSLVPGLGNLNLPLLVGIPVVLNPVYGIPFLLAPLASIGIAFGLLKLGWLVPVVYPLYNAIPGPFQGFFGSGGHLSGLIVGLICLLVSVAIYYPFVKWNARLQGRIEERRSE